MRFRMLGNPRSQGIQWVICGGERPRRAADAPDWAEPARSMAAAGVAFFMKQMGGKRKPFAPIPTILWCGSSRQMDARNREAIMVSEAKSRDWCGYSEIRRSGWDVARATQRPQRPPAARRPLDHFGNDTLHAVTKSACMAYASREIGRRHRPALALYVALLKTMEGK